MAEFTTVARVGEIPAGQGRQFFVGGKIVAVFFQDGEYFAINDACPHMGASLAEGSLEGDAIYCPWHAWRFCIRDGLWLDNPKSSIRMECYSVRILGDEIQVSVAAQTPPSPSP